MRWALAPSMSETRLDNLIWASSRRDSNWFCSRTRSRVNWYFRRVTVRHRRCSESGTKLRVNSRATNHSSLKLVLTVDFHVGHNHGQHLFMNVDSRYSVGHSSSWRERRTCCSYLNQGRGLSPL